MVQAIDEIRATFPEASVTFRVDPEGGAYVTVEPVDPGVNYKERATWIGFRITFQYPYADVYPHYVGGDLARCDNGALGPGMSVTSWEGRPATQISRRSNNLVATVDTAAIKLLKVLQWLSTR